MKEDIIAANLSSLRSDIQSLPKRIAEELGKNTTEQSSFQQLDEDKLTELISKAIDVSLRSRLDDDEKFVDKIVDAYKEVAMHYNSSITMVNKNAEILNNNMRILERRYAVIVELMQKKPSKSIEQPFMPKTMKELLRFLLIIYPWYLIKRMYCSEHFRQFLVICMACLLAISVFLTIFLAYDNAQMRKANQIICKVQYKVDPL